MKKAISILIIFLLLFATFSFPTLASDSEEWNPSTEITSLNREKIDAKSAVLMDAETGTLLYAKNPNESLAPASVTKIMTLLIVAECIDNGKISLTDKVMISKYAASMGGSQIFLKEGEEFTVEELLKSTVIASANDAAVALAEYVSGSEDLFVELMNKRAKELGMKNTNFENATGLDDDVKNHVTSAYDIALMSKELLSHKIILNYSNIWQDSVRNGEFILTNTNRLVRYYAGCTGLKTGSTDKAGFCISATAERDGLHLIAVIMGSETRDERNQSARTLLDYGFSNYAIYTDEEKAIEEVDVLRGKTNKVIAANKEFKILIDKGSKNKIERKYIIPQSITAPFVKGDVIGEIIYSVDGKEIGRSEIYVTESIENITVLDILLRMLLIMLTGK